MEEKLNSKTKEFAQCLAKCDANTFIGIAKILCVPISNGANTKEEIDMRPFAEVWSDIIESFNSLNKKQRKDLEKILRQAVS
jgi:hypothetical protein